MLSGPVRLSILAGAAALGAVGLTLALVGLGLPFIVAALVAAWAAGLVQYAAARTVPAETPLPDPAPAPESAAVLRLEEYRRHTAALRHDLRGVLSPALMMSDRLLSHTDPAVQRAGNAVVRSIDRATALLAESKDLMSTETAAAPGTEVSPPTPTAAAPAGPAQPAPMRPG